MIKEVNRNKENRQVLTSADIADILITSKDGKYDLSKLKDPNPIIPLDEHKVEFNDRASNEGKVIDKQLKKNLKYGKPSKKRQKAIDDKHQKSADIVCDVIQASIDGLKFGNDEITSLAIRLEYVMDDLKKYAFEFVSEREFMFVATSLFNAVFNENYKELDTEDKLDKAIDNINRKKGDIYMQFSEVKILIDSIIELVHVRNVENIKVDENTYADTVYVNEEWQAFKPVTYKDLNEETLYNMTHQLYNDVRDLTDQVLEEFGTNGSEACTSAFRLMSNIEQMYMHNVAVGCKAYNEFYSKPHVLYPNDVNKAIELMDNLNEEIVKALQHDALESLDSVETLSKEESVEFALEDLDNKDYNVKKLKSKSELEDGFMDTIVRCISQSALTTNLDISDLVSEMVGNGFNNVSSSLIKVSKEFRNGGLIEEADILFKIGMMRLDFDYEDKYRMGLNKFYKSPVEYFGYVTKILFSGQRFEALSHGANAVKRAFKDTCDIPVIWNKFVDVYITSSCVA